MCRRWTLSTLDSVDLAFGETFTLIPNGIPHKGIRGFSRNELAGPHTAAINSISGLRAFDLPRAASASVSNNQATPHLRIDRFRFINIESDSIAWRQSTHNKQHQSNTLLLKHYVRTIDILQPPALNDITSGRARFCCPCDDRRARHGTAPVSQLQASQNITTMARSAG